MLSLAEFRSGMAGEASLAQVCFVKAWQVLAGEASLVQVC